MSLTPGRALSPRELQIVSLASEGLTKAQIARRLDRSENTVKTHLENARTVTGAKSMAHLVALALRHGWIT